MAGWRHLIVLLLLVLFLGNSCGGGGGGGTSTVPPYSSSRECEYPDDSSVGAKVDRENASGKAVHGQFGCEASSPYNTKSGFVKYSFELTSAMSHLYLKIRYSKNSDSGVPIEIYLDTETVPRSTFVPEKQPGDSWENFTESSKMDLGQVSTGKHILKFYTDGQQWGVVELDKFDLSESL